MFGNVSNQKVKDTKERLYNELIKKGFESVKIYNYANGAYIITRTCAEAPIRTYRGYEVPVAECYGKTGTDIWRPGSDIDFKAYLNNLISEGEIKAPTKYHKPVINVVAHSMGGLKTRIMYELDETPPVYINKFVTWATPHFGTYLDVAGWFNGVSYDALSNLDRDSHLYDHLTNSSQLAALNPNRQFTSKTDNDADIRPSTEYHFMMGARIERKYPKFWENIPSFILSNDCTVATVMDCKAVAIPTPDSKENRNAFKELVEGNLSNYKNGDNFNVLDTDEWVSLNGGLGYSGKMVLFEDDLGDQLLIGKRTIFVGAKNQVGHSPIHGNKDVINKTINVLYR